MLKITSFNKINSLKLCFEKFFAVVFFITLLVTSISVFVAFVPHMPHEGLDPSWAFAMNEAIARSYVFGRDIVFTFGPYASIYTKMFHPSTNNLMIGGGLYLGFSFFLVAYLNFRSVRWQLKLSLLFILSAIMYSFDALLILYPFLTGVYLYKILSLEEKLKVQHNIRFGALLFLVFSPFGLLVLIKGTLIVICTLIIMLSTLLLIINKSRLWITIIPIVASFISTIFFWEIANQPLSALPDFFISIWPIMHGYTEAMAIKGRPNEILLYIISTFIIILTIIKGINTSIFRKIILVLIFSCTLFLAFKAGFVRHDGHALAAGTMIVFAAVIASTFLSSKRTMIVILPAFIVWVVIDSNYTKTSTSTVLINIKSTFINTWRGIETRITDPDRLQREFDNRISEIKVNGAIPLLNGTTDIYSYDQAFLIASGNNWNPRPIIQSYSVYTKELAEKNKNHLTGENRPNNVIFKVQSIDSRMPSLEDGLSWPVLLSDYEPKALVNNFLYLKHHQNKNTKLNTINTSTKSTYSLGEKIELPDHSGLTFVKINLKKSFIGRLTNILLKPNQLEIQLIDQNGSVKNYRMIAGMAASGFVVSPLIESTEEFGLLFAGKEFLDEKKIRSIKIDTSKMNISWNNTFEIELTSIDYEAQPQVINTFNYIIPKFSKEFENILIAEKCEGSIDSINGENPTLISTRKAALLKVQGWLSPFFETNVLSDDVYIVLTDSNANRYFIKTDRINRDDVGKHFNKPYLSLSGYESRINSSELSGNYSLGLAYKKSNAVFLCPQFNIPIKFLGKR